MSKGVQIALGAVACALLLGWYANSVLEDGASLTYYQPLDEFLASPESAESRLVRVHGFVALGTIDRDVSARTVRFGVQSGPPHAGTSPGGALSVEYASLEVPDLFKDGAEVVIEGKLARNGGKPVFHATNVLAKCPSKFEAKLEDASP